MSGKIEISLELLEQVADALDSSSFDVNEEVADQLRALLAAPVVERQPVAWMFRWDYEHGNGWCRNAVRFVESMEHVEHEDKSTWRDITPLYTSPPAPPAPVAVVLPERRTPKDYNGYIPSYASEAAAIWNACLDKVKELNQ